MSSGYLLEARFYAFNTDPIKGFKRHESGIDVGSLS